MMLSNFDHADAALYPGRSLLPLSRTQEIRLAGFFPGLGSRVAYRGIGDSLLRAGVPGVTSVYETAAATLGLAGGPAAVAALAEDPSTGRLDRQAAVGVSVLVHSLAVHELLRAEAGSGFGFVAYTGESFGILTAAVAAGALSIADGVRVAQAFTPLALLCAGDRDGGRAQAGLLRHLPAGVLERPVVSEPHHVLGLRSPTRTGLAAALEGLRARFSTLDVELHKRYSPRQANVYVRAGAHADFLDFVREAGSGVEVVELKEPTTFVAHSARMLPARIALRAFLAANGITFNDPLVPVLSNSGAGALRSAAGIKDAVLAMMDVVMDSRGTAELLAAVRPDAVLELGPGGRSLDLLLDNDSEAVVGPAPMSAPDAARLARSLEAVSDALRHGEDLRRAADRADLAEADLAAIRRAVRATADGRLGRAELARRTTSAHPVGGHSTAFARYTEVLRLTLRHAAETSAGDGEVVLRARLRKRLSTTLPAEPARTRLELTTAAADGRRSTRHLDTALPQVQVVHFGYTPGIDARTRRRELRQLLEAKSGQHDHYAALTTAEASSSQLAIVVLYLMFRDLSDRMPELLAHAPVCLHAVERVGGLASLAASGALTLAEVLALHRGDLSADTAEQLVVDSAVPVVSAGGVPVRARRDLVAVLRTLLAGAVPALLRLNGDCHVLALGGALPRGQVDADGHAVDTLDVPDHDALRARPGTALARYRRDCLLRVTPENTLTVATAQARRITIGTVNAYVEAGEEITGFGQGGSESMTIFVRKEGDDEVTVRKILSESLTTAPWNPAGTGVMLPPFTKAWKQAEFLTSLPDALRDCFPRVLRALRRTVHVPVDGGGHRSDREVIYEMSYVAGEEVSGFVRRHSPPPAVVARLYEQVFRVLRSRVHRTGRTAPSGDTLETSYFRKIEDRLRLCRRTAPRTFGPALLDSDHLVVDGAPYLNAGEVLRRFRENPAFRRALEPRFHSLVVGDTNTENIKIGNTATLLAAQRAVEGGGSAAEVAAALRAVTPEALDLRFLDPRAIGFRSEGRDTRDDPMYDNKPWHNSIGHYDEIHFEHFTLAADFDGPRPEVSIRFTPGNPYQRSYRVRDVTAGDGAVDPARPRGVEDHFAAVMTAAFDLEDPERSHELEDPYWLVRFVFMMGQHFTAMPPFHFQRELDGTLCDDPQNQRRPIAIYCEGIKWLNWSLQMLEGRRTEFLGLPVALPDELRLSAARRLAAERTVA
ncbi:ACP S-malonyltransferase [Actinokineospora globicatena]